MVELGDLEVYPAAEKSFPCFFAIDDTKFTNTRKSLKHWSEAFAYNLYIIMEHTLP